MTFRWRSALVLTMLMVVAWLLWSGIYKTHLLVLGAFSCALVVYLAYRLGFFARSTGLLVIPKLPGYWLRLLGEIARSSLEVCRIVLHPRLPISPTLVTLKAKPEGPIGQVILSNAITLSPGTVVLDVDDGQLSVHCLTETAARELLDGDANDRAAALTDR